MPRHDHLDCYISKTQQLETIAATGGTLHSRSGELLGTLWFDDENHLKGHVQILALLGAIRLASRNAKSMRQRIEDISGALDDVLTILTDGDLTYKELLENAEVPNTVHRLRLAGCPVQPPQGGGVPAA